jgi:F0F1-type ATP synthase assembly protein I
VDRPLWWLTGSPNQGDPPGRPYIMPPEKKPVWSQISDYASIGFMLPACTVTGYYLGVLLDHLFHTRYLNIVFLIIGIAAGFVELIRIVSKRSG